MKLQDIKVIIGLGNPDKEYEKTYHNVGFLFIDYLLKSRNYCQRAIGHCEEQSDEATSLDCFAPLAMTPLLKSDTHMNQSGTFVRLALKKYKARPEEILIIHDDSDIELKKYKFSFGRGSAGHKGVESIIKALKTKNFWRLRIGIRQEERGKRKEERDRIKAEEFVLKKINKKDLAVFNKVLEEAQKNLFYSDLTLPRQAVFIS